MGSKQERNYGITEAVFCRSDILSVTQPTVSEHL